VPTLPLLIEGFPTSVALQKHIPDTRPQRDSSCDAERIDPSRCRGGDKANRPRSRCRYSASSSFGSWEPNKDTHFLRKAVHNFVFHNILVVIRIEPTTIESTFRDGVIENQKHKCNRRV
jgi:hypothetical protein